MSVNLTQANHEYTGNAALGGGSGVVLDQSKNIALQFEAAQSKAKNDWDKYKVFQDNVKEFFKNANDIDATGLMHQDRDEIMGEFEAFLEEAGNNIDVIMNPLKNRAKYGQIEAMDRSLRTKIQQSKADSAFMQLHDNFLTNTPALNNDLNRGKLSSFATSGMKDRKAFTLAMPTVFDPAAMAKIAAETAMAQYAKAGHDKQWIYTEEGKKYYQDEYDKAVIALGGAQDQAGNTVLTQAKNVYDTLSAEEKKKFGTADNFYKETLRNLMPQDQITKKTEQESQYGLLDKRHAQELVQMNKKFGFDKVLKGMDRENALAVEKWKADNEVKTAAELGTYLNDVTISAITNAGATSKSYQKLKLAGKTDYQTFKVAGEVNPQLKTALSRVVKVNDDGKEIVAPPDKILVDGNNLIPIWFKRKDNDWSTNQIDYAGNTAAGLQFPAVAMSPEEVKAGIASVTISKDKMAQVYSRSNNLLAEDPDIRSANLNVPEAFTGWGNKRGLFTQADPNTDRVPDREVTSSRTSRSGSGPAGAAPAGGAAPASRGPIKLSVFSQ